MERESEKQDMLRKIQHCLALSKSANENEAAIALSQARALMKKWQVTHDDLLILDVKEAACPTKTSAKPNQWEVNLVGMIEVLLGCKSFLKTSTVCRSKNEYSYTKTKTGQWVFVGVEPAAEIATYAFDVLHRQVMQARKDFIKINLKRVKIRQNKIRRADTFCLAWVQAARNVLSQFLGSGSEDNRLELYMQKNHPSLSTFDPANRSKDRVATERDLKDRAAGLSAGKKAKLERGVQNDTVNRIASEE